MRLRKTVLALLCVLLVGAVFPASGLAAFYNSKGTSADAWWSSWSWENGEPGPDDATLDWNISANTGTSIFKDAGMALDMSKGSFGWASMYSYTPTDGAEPRAWAEFTCFGEPPSVLTFGRGLGTAQLEILAEGTLRVWKGAEPWIQIGPEEWEMREPDEETTEMVSVMASWKAIGPLTRSSYVMRERSADTFWSDRTSGTYRRAMADASIVGASGTIYMQSGDLPAGDAQISDYKSNGRFRGQLGLE